MAGSEPDPEHLRRREQQRVDYLVAGEYDRLAEMASPTLSYTHSNAALDSKEGFLRDLRSGRVVYRSMRHRDVDIRFVSPDVAILNGLTDAVVTVDGQDRMCRCGSPSSMCCGTESGCSRHGTPYGDPPREGAGDFGSVKNRE